MLALAAGVLMVGALVGCVPGDPQPTRSPTASHTPLFASDEAALKAATGAYAAYLKMSDTILQAGGQDPERMSQVATGSALKTELSGFETARSRSWRQKGNTRFSNIQLQSVSAHSITVYVCVDVSHVDVVDSGGKSVVSESRPARSAAVIGMVADSHSLQVATNEPWNGDGVC